MKEYCSENLLSRGRTNHNIGTRVTYIRCSHYGCEAKLRLIRKMDGEKYVLEFAEGFDHQHNELQNAPGRGLSADQKRIILDCYARESSEPKKVF